MLETLDEFTTFLAATALREAQPPSADSLVKAQERHPVAWMLLAARAACQIGANRVDIKQSGNTLTLDIRGVTRLEEGFASAWSERNYSAERVGLLVQIAECLPKTGLAFSFVDANSEAQVFEITPGTSPKIDKAGPLLQIAWTPPANYPHAKALSTLTERLRFSPLAVFINGNQVNKPFLHQTAHFSPDVKGNNQPSLRRNFLERIWLPKTPLQDQFMIADPFATSAHCLILNSQAYPGAPGTTNVREFCQAKDLACVGPKGKSIAWTQYPRCHWNVFKTPGTGISGLLGSQDTHKAVAVGAVLRLGRRHRGTGLLFPIHQGVLLDPVDLGDDFSGCWAFVAAPCVQPTPGQGQAEADPAREMLVDWTKSQFVHMNDSLQRLISGRDSERLGLGFDFQKELRQARSGFQKWDEGRWGDPSKDF